MLLHKEIDEIDALRRALADDSRAGFFRLRRAARRLARLATGGDGRRREPGPEEARAIVEGLVAGLESVHWGPHLTCRHALERIKDPQLKEAVCQVIIEQDLPRLNAIAVQGRYAPQDPASKAAYLYVIGISQFYEAHDPEGKLLERFYMGAPSPIRDRILGLVRKRGDQGWERLVTEILRSQGGAAMGEVELTAALEVLTAGRSWEELWALVRERLLPWSWRGVRVLAEAGWQPQKGLAAAYWEELVATVRTEEEPAEVTRGADQAGAARSEEKPGAAREVLSDGAHDPEERLLEQFYVKASRPIRDRILGRARSRGDQWWVPLITAFLHSRKWTEMSEAEAKAAAEVLVDESHDPQGKLVEQLERFYVEAPPTLRDRVLGQGHPGRDQRQLIVTNLRSRGTCAKWLIENQRDGTLLVLIPEGEFLAGGPGSDEGRGKFKVRLPAYYLAAHPVTNAQYARFLSERRPGEADLKQWIFLDKDCFVRKLGSGYKPYGGKEDHPVVEVSWYGAEAYCQWAGLRLPSELEWEKGARGTDGREYPWGNDWEGGRRCRWDENRGRETTCDIWSYPEECSPGGLYQMAGNVWEWCGDWYESEAYDRYKRGDLKPSASGKYRVVRGGSWYDFNTDSFRCAYRLGFSLVDTPQNFLSGFRCARSLS